MNDVVFPSKIDLVNYIVKGLHDENPIKIQGVLYYSYALYSATYSCIDISQSELRGSGITYPKELFEANFRADRYGAIDDEAWQYYVNNILNIKRVRFSKITTLKMPCVVHDIKLFIDSIIHNIDAFTDYSLVSTMHKDTAWKQAYSSENHLMNNQVIKAEYMKRMG